MSLESAIFKITRAFPKYLLGMFLLLLLIPNGLNNYLTLVTSFFVLIVCVMNWDEVSFDSSDISLGFFIVVGLVLNASFHSWSLALPSISSWYILFSIVVILKALTESQKSIIIHFLRPLFSLVLVLNILSVVVELIMDVDYFQLTGINNNVRSFYLVFLFASNVLLFRVKQLSVLIFIFQLLLVLVILLYLQSRGSLILLGFLVITYFLELSKYKKERVLLFICAIVALFASFFYLLGDHFDPARYGMSVVSFEIFMDNLMLGIGLGNWPMVACQYGIGDLIHLNSGREIKNIGPHDQWLVLLVELGVGGFIFLLLYFIRLLLKAHNYDASKRSFVFLFILYLMGSMVYRDVNFYQNNYSFVDIYFFVLIGVLTGNHERLKSFSQLWRIVFLSGCILNILWLAVELPAQRNYNSLINNSKCMNAEDFEYLEHFFVPYVSQSLGFGRNPLLAMAMFYTESSKSKAMYYYEEGIKYEPYNDIIRFEYATFLYEKSALVEEALSHLKILILSRGDNSEIRLLLAKCYADLGDYIGAYTIVSGITRKHLTRNAYEYELLNLCLAEMAMIERDYYYLDLYRRRVFKPYLEEADVFRYDQLFENGE